LCLPAPASLYSSFFAATADQRQLTQTDCSRRRSSACVRGFSLDKEVEEEDPINVVWEFYGIGQ
jgi:hypothetical protein